MRPRFLRLLEGFDQPEPGLAVVARQPLEPELQFAEPAALNSCGQHWLVLPRFPAGLGAAIAGACLECLANAVLQFSPLKRLVKLPGPVQGRVEEIHRVAAEALAELVVQFGPRQDVHGAMGRRACGLHQVVHLGQAQFRHVALGLAGIPDPACTHEGLAVVPFAEVYVEDVRPNPLPAGLVNLEIVLRSRIPHGQPGYNSRGSVLCPCGGNREQKHTK